MAINFPIFDFALYGIAIVIFLYIVYTFYKMPVKDLFNSYKILTKINLYDFLTKLNHY